MNSVHPWQRSSCCMQRCYKTVLARKQKAVSQCMRSNLGKTTGSPARTTCAVMTHAPRAGSRALGNCAPGSSPHEVHHADHYSKSTVPTSLTPYPTLGHPQSTHTYPVHLPTGQLHQSSPTFPTLQASLTNHLHQLCQSAFYPQLLVSCQGQNERNSFYNPNSSGLYLKRRTVGCGAF